MPDMMRCPHCGEEIDMSEDPIFCEHCGKDLLSLGMDAPPLPEPNPVSEHPSVTPVSPVSSMPNETEKIHSSVPRDFEKPSMSAPKTYRYMR